MPACGGSRSKLELIRGNANSEDFSNKSQHASQKLTLLTSLQDLLQEEKEPL